MNSVKVILRESIPSLGEAGEVITVKPGHAHNYLIPQGLAVTANNRNVRRLEHERKIVEARVKKEVGSATDIAARINGMTLQFERQVGEDEKLFGSVTSRDIAEQLKRANVEIDHRWVALDQPVKALGKYEVPVKLSAGVIATLKFWVVGKDK